MSRQSITLILQQLRDAGTEDEREAAAAQLYRCCRSQVEKLARGRLLPGGGLADEEDVAQSAFRSFFGRIETGQLDALVTGGQAWAILARLTRNKAIDSLRYDNAMCRGGHGGRRAAPSESRSFAEGHALESWPGTQSAAGGETGNRVGKTAAGRPHPAARGEANPTTGAGRAAGPANGAAALPRPIERASRRQEDLPLEAICDRSQRSGEEQAASNELIAYFLERLSEATLRGIVSLKMQGFTNEEIAQQLGCATRTVERKLNLIRRLWIPILESSDERRRC
jgi:RNA polymerase sigma factor (sigma-70 family)